MFRRRILLQRDRIRRLCLYLGHLRRQQPHVGRSQVADHEFCPPFLFDISFNVVTSYLRIVVQHVTMFFEMSVHPVLIFARIKFGRFLILPLLAVSEQGIQVKHRQPYNNYLKS